MIAGGERVVLPASIYAHDTAIQPTNAVATFNIGAGRTYDYSVYSVGQPTGIWLLNSLNWGAFSVRFTLVSGDEPLGVYGSWQSLSTEHTLVQQETTNNYAEKDGTVRVEIARTADTSVVLASCDVRLVATVEV